MNKVQWLKWYLLKNNYPQDEIQNRADFATKNIKMNELKDYADYIIDDYCNKCIGR